MTKEGQPLVAEKSVLIHRTVQAPRTLVFKAWSDPVHLKQWYAPEGCTIDIHTFDFRVGGQFLTCIKNPAYKDCWCTGKFLDIIKPERIVYLISTCDEHGAEKSPAELGMDPEWPMTTLVTVTFEEENRRTKITLHQTVSEAVAKRTGAHPGWLSMLDRLADALSNQVF